MNKKLTHTQSLLNHVFWFKQDLNIQPSKEHIGSAINFTDIKERKLEFLKELINTVVSWVYNQSKVKMIVDERLRSVEGDLGNAYSFVTDQAFSKFRPKYPQGQFGELLLFNFIQHFFEAAPLLRKQPITTSRGHERFGADAIHYKNVHNENIFILGESKCYKSDYQFRNAFETSITSIQKAYNDLSSELDLYIYDDFIDENLKDIAKEYKANKLSNVRFELVCLIAYNEKKERLGDSEKEIKESIKGIIENRCESLEKGLFNDIDKRILKRINYIIFPIWELDQLLESFQMSVRVK